MLLHLPNAACDQDQVIVKLTGPFPTAAKSASADRLELSGMSHLLKSLKNNDVRTDKVASVRGEIEAGTYEDDRKLAAAIDRLLDELDR